MKRLYIAAPFFTPAQLDLVVAVEALVVQCGLNYYSPRMDGVLKDMTAEQKRQEAPAIFKMNMRQITMCDGMLCLLDYPDTGTTWESGFAYYHRRYNVGKHHYRVMALFTGTKPLNVMLQQCFDGVAPHMNALFTMLQRYDKEQYPLTYEHIPGDVY